MNHYIKQLKRVLCLCLCCAVLATGSYVLPGQGDESLGTTSGYYPDEPVYMTEETIGVTIREIAEAYLHGGDHIVDAEQAVGVQAVDAATVIQEQTIDKKWFPANNKEMLHSLYAMNTETSSDPSVDWSLLDDCQWLCKEAERLSVVAYDDQWVVFWSNGYKGFDQNAWDSEQERLFSSHAPGFYQIEREKVWLNSYSQDNVIPEDDNAKPVGVGQVIVASAAVEVTPIDSANGSVFYLGLNDQVQIMSSEPVASLDEETNDTYYQIRFKADEANGYLSQEGYYYIKTSDVNLQTNDVALPDHLGMGYITLPKGYHSLYLYSEKEVNSQKTAGIIANQAKVFVLSDESDTKWTTVWFNDQRAYVQTKRIRWCVTDLHVKTISKDRYVLSWNRLPITTMIAVYVSGSDQTIGETITGHSANQFTVARSYFADHNVITVKVMPEYADAEAVGQSIDLMIPAKPKAISGSTTPNTIKIKTDKVYKLQYATNKSFKNAVTVVSDKPIAEIKKLKKNNTYYVRYCKRLTVQTEAGKKYVFSNWSPRKTLKTKNVTPTPTKLTLVQGAKKAVKLKWKKATKSVSGYQILISTKKSFSSYNRIKVANNAKTSYTVKKLKAKKTYYVKIRTYYKLNGVTYFSGWSTRKTVKTK